MSDLPAENTTPEQTVWGGGAPQAPKENQWPLNYQYDPPVSMDNHDLLDGVDSLRWQFEGFGGPSDPTD